MTPAAVDGIVRVGRLLLRLVVAPPPKALANPKSSTFTTPSGVILTLAGFRSRCTLPFSCAASRPWQARLQFLQAVFFTFSGVGFLLDLANPRPGRTAHIVFLVFMGGAIGVAYGFCFMQVPKLLPALVAVHVVLAFVLTPHLGSLAVDWAQVASTAAGVDVIGCLFAILLGYVCFVRFVRRQGLRYFRIQTEIELAEQVHRSLVPSIARHASQDEFYGF